MSEDVMPGDLTKGPEWKVLLNFSFPLLLANLLQQLYLIIDSIIVGQFIGVEALAAVSACYFVYYFVISLMIGVGSGITVIVAQYFGAKRYNEVQLAATSFIIFILFAGIFLSVGGIYFADDIFQVMQTPAEVIPAAVEYFHIYIGGSFIFLIFNSLISILRGIGDARRPLVFILISSLLNAVLCYLFVVPLDWGIRGAALSTVVAQLAGVVIAIVYTNLKHPIISFRWKRLRFDSKIFMQGVRIGLPTSIQQSAIALGLIALLGIVNSFGTATLTAYGAAGKIDTFVSQPILALCSALTAFTGQNIGAQRFDRIKNGLRYSLLISAIISISAAIAITFFGDKIMMLFTTDQEVITIGKEYLLIVCSFYIFHGLMNTYNGLLRGSGATFFPMVVSLISLWIIRIPFAYLFSEIWGVTGVWWSIVTGWVLGFVATYIYYKMNNWKEKAVV
ncbi:MAG: MATE family efflux transporter [Bacteroidales bacterium]|nr:MATE family efflux transporter [Bacteroidales bacterium]